MALSLLLLCGTKEEGEGSPLLLDLSVTRQDRKIPPQRAFRNFGLWPDGTRKFLWASHEPSLALLDLLGQEPLGSLQNSHFANAKPRFLRPPITFHGETCRERQLAPLSTDYKEKQEGRSIHSALPAYGV